MPRFPNHLHPDSVTDVRVDAVVRAAVHTPPERSQEQGKNKSKTKVKQRSREERLHLMRVRREESREQRRAKERAEERAEIIRGEEKSTSEEEMGGEVGAC